MKRNALQIGYAGSLVTGGTCYSRMLALQSVEPNVFPFDTDEELSVASGTRLTRMLEHWPAIGAGSRRLNVSLLKFVRDKNINLLWKQQRKNFLDELNS